MNLQQLLLLLAGGNQNQFSSNQQNPLLALLGNYQQPDVTQQLITLLGGVTGQQQNSINPALLQLLSGVNQQQQQSLEAQLLQLISGKQNNSELDATKLLEILQGGNQKPKEKTFEEQLKELLSNNQKIETGEDDIVTLLQKQFEKSNEQADTEAELADAIKFGFDFDKFAEANEDLFPSWFSMSEVKEDVDRWAKNPAERAQGLAAATVRAFFKNEEMLDLLEERDRNSVKEKILKDGIKSHEIDRKFAWPLLERAIFNKGKIADLGQPLSGTKDENAIAAFEARFKTGQHTAEHSAANE